MERSKALAVNRLHARGGVKMAPRVVFSVVSRVADKLTRVYNKAFVSPEAIRVDFHKEQGFAYFRQGDYVKARDAFFHYLGEVESRDTSILYMLAMCYKNMDEDKEAAEFLRKADRIAKNDPQIINALGESLYHIEEYPEAITLLMKAARLDPLDAGIYYRLGVCHEKIKDHQEAERLYKKAIALDASRVEYHQTLGFLYKAQDRHKDAIQCLRKALDAQWRQKRAAG